MRSYEVARTIYSILEILAWASIVIGLIAALGGASAGSSFARNGAGLLGAVPGIIIMISGIFLVGSVQSWRANVDSAEYGQQMLKVARDQLEVSKQALRTSDSQPNTFGALRAEQEAGRSDRPEKRVVPAAPVKHAPDEVIEYRDRSIVRNGMAFSVSGKEFVSLERAKRAIDLELKDAVPVELTKRNADALANSRPEQEQPSPQQIVEVDGKYVFGNMSFGSREAADRYVQQLGVNPNFKS